MSIKCRKWALSALTLAIAAALCGAVIMFGGGKSATVRAEEAPVFEIDTVASVRLSTPELRFRVKMDEATNAKATADGASLHVVIAPTADFAGKSGDEYASIAGATTVEVAADRIYEEGGAFYANASIVPDDLKKNYTAAAYIENGGAKTWSKIAGADGQPLAQSYQAVASRLFFKEEATRLTILGANDDLGTAALPILVAGKNGYAALAGVAEAAAGKTFELTENLVVDEKVQGVTFAGENKPYTLDEMYTVNHTVLDVYSVGDSIALGEKVSAEFGALTFGVTSQPEGSKATIAENNLTFDAAGAYVVKANVGEFEGVEFTVEVSTGKHPDGKIFDPNTAAEIPEGETTYPKGEPASTITVSFDDTVKYDSASAGSMKIVMHHENNAEGVQYSADFKPAYSREYYQELAKDGYDYVAIRMRIDRKDLLGTNGEFAIQPFRDSDADVQMKLLSDHGKQFKEYSFNAWNTWYTQHYPELGGGEGEIYGNWFELLYPLETFVTRYYRNPMNLLRLSFLPTTIGGLITSEGTATVYIDDIYATKQFEEEHAFNEEYVDYRAQDGQEINVYETAGLSASDLDLIDASSLLDGTAVEIGEDGKYTLETKGFYTFLLRARNRYGAAGFRAYTGGGDDVLIVDPSKDPSEIFSTEIVYTGSKGNEDGAVTLSKSEDDTFQEGEAAVKVSATTKATDGTNTKDMTVKIGFTIAHSKEYYRSLKSLGYQYIDFHLKVQHVNNKWESMCFYALKDKEGFMEGGCYTGEDFSQNVWKESAYWNNDNGKGIWSGNGWGAAKLGWFTLRYPIDDFLTNYDTAGNFWLKSVYASPGTFNFLIGAVRVVKDPSFVRPAVTA